MGTTSEFYHFDIILLGEATKMADSVIAACQQGQSLGLGPKRTRFSIISICSVLPTGLKAGVHQTRLSDWLQSSILSESPTIEPQVEIAIHCETPVRLKTDGKIFKQHIPSLEEWLNHVVRRWKKLSELWVLDNKELFEGLYQELPQLGDYETNAHLYFEDWQRYSLKEKSHLPFGGLKGQISYFGDISVAIPWLVIGEQLQIGGKTTFGLGHYKLIA